MEDELKSLKDNIWKTRKARINAAERLNKNALFIKFLNIYYSCAMIIINLIDITNQNYNLEILLLSMSIVLTISIISFDSQQYCERAERLKNCYISLQKLYYEINVENINEKREEYFELLGKTENHSEYDYYKVEINTEKISLNKFLSYYFHTLIIFLIKILVIMLPIIFLYTLFN